MIYVECPHTYPFRTKNKSLFLAGEISNCYDWQTIVSIELVNTDLIIYNPRRKNFDVNEKDITKKQIEWEHFHLRKADIISFWFSKETLCPITLFELGVWTNYIQKLVIGIDPKYERKIDVEIQISLVDPDFKFVYSINDLTKRIREKINE
jgi:hypothetical protein